MWLAAETRDFRHTLKMAVAPGRREHRNQRDVNVLLSVHVWERNTLQKVEVFKERVLHIKSGVLLSFGVKFYSSL